MHGEQMLLLPCEFLFQHAVKNYVHSQHTLNLLLWGGGVERKVRKFFSMENHNGNSQSNELVNLNDSLL